MVLVTGHAPIRPEARRVVIQAASRMRKLTMRNPGCITYRFSFALDAPHDLVLIEEWIDGEALARHLSSAHFATLSHSLRSALRGPASFTRYEVATASPLFS